MSVVAWVGLVFPLGRLALSVRVARSTTASALRQSRKRRGFLPSNALSPVTSLVRLPLLVEGFHLGGRIHSYVVIRKTVLLDTRSREQQPEQ